MAPDEAQPRVEQAHPAVEAVPARRQRSRRGVRRLAGGLSPARWAAALLMSITAVVASVSFVLLLRPAAPDTSHLAGPPLEVPAPGTAAASTAPSGSAPTVRLVAGAGDLDVPVIPGDGATVPLNRAMHYPRTAWPGDGSNSLFYAHAQPHMFLGLYRLHPGDDVVAFRSDGSQLTYRVRAVERVAYSDQNVLKPTAFEQLTLLTCTSYNPVEPRLVVIATPA